MYAVIETGGKQYRVQKDDVLEVERLSATSEKGSEVVFDRVLLLGGDELKVGSPIIDGAQVKAISLGDVRGPKILVFKKKKRKQYRRKNGHRQDLVRVRIAEIVA
jgi:large subunit ribosomal protein L21